MTADRYDPQTWPPGAWKWFGYGMARGFQSGYDVGYGDGWDANEADASAAWAEVAAAVRDQGRTGRFVPPGRRVPYNTPALSAAEIRASAFESWGLSGAENMESAA